MLLILGKKGDLEIWTLVEIILIIIGVIILIAIIIQTFSEAEEGTAENLCRASNAIRYGTEIDTSIAKINVVPRACKTIDKGNLPTKDYKQYEGGIKEGAKAELRESISKCWWMWLEGRKGNMFHTSTIQLQNNCFICYAFSLDKDVDTITTKEFVESLEQPYYAIDKSDRCAGAGQGGFCRSLCDDQYEKEVSSNKCKPLEKCCISKKINNECVNKKGICFPREGYLPYDKWKCADGRCYVDKNNVASYLDYIQGTKGVQTGAGFFALEDATLRDGIENRKKYAITLISPGNDVGFDTGLLLGATAVLGAGTIAGTYYAPTPFLKKTAFESGALATAVTYKLAENSGSPVGYNFIYISEYDKIKEKCAIELGTDAR